MGVLGCALWHRPPSLRAGSSGTRLLIEARDDLTDELLGLETLREIALACIGFVLNSCMSACEKS